MKKPIGVHSTSGIILFYPGTMLTAQILEWAEQYGGCRAAVCFERSLPGIRKRLRSASLAVIDATEDPAQAADALLQSVSVRRAESVVIYTEKMHSGLEMLVRMFGVPLFLGPMSTDDWEEYLQHKFPSLIPLDALDQPADWSDSEILRIGGKNGIDYYKPKAG